VTFPRNVDCRWFVTREGTWAVRVCFDGREDGVVIDTHETRMSTAMKFAAFPIENAIAEECLRMEANR
jgi:hypothetical protein